MVGIEPFRIEVSDAVLKDLQDRLARTRLPDEVLEDETEAAALMARALRWSVALPAKVKKAKAR